MSNEAKQGEQHKEWNDAVGVFLVHEDGRELLLSAMAPSYRPELAVEAAKRAVKDGAHARVLRFSAREVLFDGAPTPEDAAKLKADIAEHERKQNAELASLFEGLAGQLRKEPEAT